MFFSKFSFVLLCVTVNSKPRSVACSSSSYTVQGYDEHPNSTQHHQHLQLRRASFSGGEQTRTTFNTSASTCTISNTASVSEPFSLVMRTRSPSAPLTQTPQAPVNHPVVEMRSPIALTSKFYAPGGVSFLMRDGQRNAASRIPKRKKKCISSLLLFPAEGLKGNA